MKSLVNKNLIKSLRGLPLIPSISNHFIFKNIANSNHKVYLNKINDISVQTSRSFSDQTISSEEKIEPITDDAFDKIMRPIMKNSTSSSIAVGVSGGPDSLSLTFLLSRWCKRNYTKLIAYIVDHGIRENSAEEARSVKKYLESLNIQSKIITPISEKPSSPSKYVRYAREIRYEAFEEQAKKDNITSIFLGHQQEDQIETFCYRLGKGSGVEGLAVMDTVSLLNNNLYLVRPFLGISKRQLLQTCIRYNLKWIEDPTNKSPIYARNRIRMELESKVYPLISRAEMMKLVTDAKLANHSIHKEAKQFIKEKVFMNPMFGLTSFNTSSFNKLPQYLRHRIIIRLMRHVCGTYFFPLDKVERMRDFLKSKQIEPSRTHIANGIIEIDPRIDIGFIYRAPESHKQLSMVPIKSGQTINFLNLYEITITSQQDPNFSAFVSMLNMEDYKKIINNPAVRNLFFSKYRSLNITMKQSLPIVVSHKREIIAIPSLGITQPHFICKGKFSPKFDALSDVSVQLE